MEKRWRWWACGLALVAALLAGVAAAGPRTDPAGGVVALDPVPGAFALDGRGEAWLDAGGAADAPAVAAGAAGTWTPTAPGHVYQLRSGQALWFRFTLTAMDDDERWYLEVPYPAVDRVTLYAQDARGHWSVQAAGDRIAVAEWPLPHRHPLLPLLLDAGAEQRFLLRVQNVQSFSAPLEFTSERELVRREQRSGLLLGIYFGLAGLSVVLALLAAAWLRDAAFGWYGLTVLLMGLEQAALTGVAGLHLWPRWPWWNDVSPTALATATAASLLWFVSSTVSLPERSRRAHALLAVLSAACLLATGALLLVDPAWRTRVLAPVVVLALLAGVAVVVWAASRGDRHAVWLLLGMVPAAVGAAFPLARATGLLATSFWTANAMQIGIAIELPVLMAMLLARNHDRRENSRRLHGLQRIDPATGLINAQVFMERLEQLIARSERLRQEGVVLLVDITNVAVLRRDFEPGWAEELPLRVAGRLLSAAREIDSVARLSEYRFGILVEGPLTPDEAAAAGSRVVARCLMPFKDRPLEWVPQARVAQATVPNGMHAGQLVERLGAVLAAVPADSRRAVFPLR